MKTKPQMLLVALSLLFALPSEAKTLRAVFQLPEQASIDSFLEGFGQLPSKPALQSVRFGLTDEQIRDLREATGGEVDFGGIYFLDHEAALDSRQLQGYRGEIYPDVPPPGNDADPVLEGQYWFEKLNVRKAWSLATGRGVTVADCDAGFYVNEPDIAGNLVTDERYDLSDKNHPLQVDDGAYVMHGTAVVNILAGVRDGALMNGIAFDAKVVPLQNYNYSPELDSLDKEEATAQCILRAIKLPNVRIIVLENQTINGSSETFVGTREAVKLALQAGITIVSAGGNNGVELTEEENHDTSSIIVGALTRHGTPESYTNYSEKRVTVAAFGEGLTALIGPGGQMGEFGGTSGATPQVAATVALMLEANPGLTPAQVKQLLAATRVQSASTAKVGGQLDVYGAVSKAKTTAPDVAHAEAQAALRARVAQILSR